MIPLQKKNHPTTIGSHGRASGRVCGSIIGVVQVTGWDTAASRSRYRGCEPIDQAAQYSALVYS